MSAYTPRQTVTVSPRAIQHDQYLLFILVNYTPDGSSTHDLTSTLLLLGEEVPFELQQDQCLWARKDHQQREREKFTKYIRTQATKVNCFCLDGTRMNEPAWCRYKLCVRQGTRGGIYHGSLN